MTPDMASFCLTEFTGRGKLSLRYENECVASCCARTRCWRLEFDQQRDPANGDGTCQPFQFRNNFAIKAVEAVWRRIGVLNAPTATNAAARNSLMFYDSPLGSFLSLTLSAQGKGRPSQIGQRKSSGRTVAPLQHMW
jgi:hypothetical protein